MSKKSVLKARYTLTPTLTPGVVEIGILPKDLIKLTAKMTFWGMLPSILIIGGLIVIGTYEESKNKTSDSESPNQD